MEYVFQNYVWFVYNHLNTNIVVLCHLRMSHIHWQNLPCFALPRFYSSPKRTNRTLALEILSHFFTQPCKGVCEAKIILFVFSQLDATKFHILVLYIDFTCEQAWQLLQIKCTITHYQLLVGRFLYTRTSLSNQFMDLPVCVLVASARYPMGELRQYQCAVMISNPS